jgi:cation diffusion facilitator family transporter
MKASQTASDDAAHYASVQRVLVAVLAANLFVTAIKIFLGFVTGALAVIADGFHSLVDSSSNLVGLFAIRMARRPADDRHPYGYRRYETLGALAIGGLLLVAAWEIGTSIISRIISGAEPTINPLIIILIVLTLPLNILIVFIETRAGKQLNSEILLADAKHTQTDIYVTVSVILSLVGVWLGWIWSDALVATGVVFLIVRAAFSILSDTTRWLTDAKVADATKVEEVARAAPGVRFVHRIRSRGTPEAAFVDLHVKVSPEMGTAQAHAVATEVERRLVAQLPNILDALVHIEPASDNDVNPWERMANDLRQTADGMGLGAHDLHVHTDLRGAYTVEVHLEILDDISLGEAHSIADQFESRVRQRWSQIEEIITHLEPIHRKVLLPESAPDSVLESQIREILARHVRQDQIMDVDVYQFSGHMSASVKLALSSQLPLAAAHDVSESIEADMLKNIPALQRVTVHLEPEPES